MVKKRSVLVALIGPDGSGKSTVARGLSECNGLSFSSRTVHRWTLGALPALAPLIDAVECFLLATPGPAPRDTDSAGRHSGMYKPLPVWQSALIVGYHALDMALSRVWLWLNRGKASLKVLDRSFLDFYVLPGHAALPRWFLDVCWKLAAKPALLLVIDREAADIYRDKPELTEAEIQRQQAVLALLPQGCGRVRHLNGRWGVQVMIEQAAAAVDSLRLDGAETGPLTMFLEQAQRTPEAVALEDGSTRWTYAQLRARAARTAQALRRAGARPGDVVALQGGRSRELPAALLGTWMAGGVALMLDEQHPVARRRTMCASAGVRWAVQLSHTDHGPSGAWVAALGLPARAEVRTTASDEQGPDPITGLHGAGAAYVMFTSGTTGAPKGIIGSHEGLGHFLDWQRRRFELGPSDRVAHLTHMAFDVVLREMLVPLVSGACLVIPDADDEWPDRVIPWMNDRRITLLHAVPSLAQRWLASAPASRRHDSHLRWTLFAGEPLSDTLVQAWRDANPATRVANLYGPTETTLAKFCAEVPDPPPPGLQAVGQPLPGCRTFVVDPAGRLCAAGEAGEVWLATAHRALRVIGQGSEGHGFVPNPLTQDPTDLVYRTGDLGCWKTDGTLQILGRLDGQIKVRGVRVEPAEVEAVMMKLPGVQQALVGAVADAQGQLSLVACVVMDRPDADLGPLQSVLREHLPVSMRPSHLRRADTLPLTERGKLDRKELGRWFDTTRAAPAGSWPDTVQASRLRQAWAEILGHDGFGPSDDFFSVGGDSLKALMLALRVAKWTGRAPQASWAYEQPTPQAQLGWWDAFERGIAGLGSMQPMVFGAGRSYRVVGLPPLLGYGLVYHRLARNLPDHEIVAFDFPDHGDPIDAYMQALQGEVRPLVLLGYSAGGNLAFELAKRWEAHGGSVQRIVMLDTNRWLEPAQLDDQEIEQIIAGNLAHLQGLFDHDEHFARYAEEHEAVQAMAARMRAFLRYERNHLNTGTVQADIVYVRSEQFEICRSWRSATTGRWVEAQGFGPHLQMLLGSTADRNAAVIGSSLLGH